MFLVMFCQRFELVNMVQTVRNLQTLISGTQEIGGPHVLHLHINVRDVKSPCLPVCHMIFCEKSKIHQCDRADVFHDGEHKAL